MKTLMIILNTVVVCYCVSLYVNQDPMKISIERAVLTAVLTE
jgi:hypothetical protein